MTLTRKRILVVEDFDIIRKFICRTLEIKGYDTIAASNVTEAFELLTHQSSDIDLVLTDYNMPGADGYELLTKMKANDEMKNIPVIFLTTEQNPEKIKTAQDAGVSGLIRKPYRAEFFFHTIAKTISEASTSKINS
jgi:two-component system, chemotaxis family, chemotaxis protein CheY